MEVLRRKRNSFSKNLALARILADFSGYATLEEPVGDFRRVKDLVNMLNHQLRFTGLFLPYGTLKPSRFSIFFRVFGGLSLLNCLLIMAELFLEMQKGREDVLKLINAGLNFGCIFIGLLNVAFLYFIKPTIVYTYVELDTFLQNTGKEFVRAKAKHRDLAFMRIRVVSRALEFVTNLSAVLVVLGGVVFGFLMSFESNWSFAYQLLFFPPDTPLGYVANLTHVIWGIVFTIYCFHCMGQVFFTVCIGNLLMFDILLELIDNMKEIVDETCFDHWITITMELIVTLRSYLMVLKGDADGFLLIYQKFSYFVLMCNWILIKIDVAQIGLAGAGTVLVGVFVVVILTNELFLYKFKQAEKRLYNSPWYSLSPAQRQALVPLLCATQRAISLSAGGIRTLRWFGLQIFLGLPTKLGLLLWHSRETYGVPSS